MVKEDVMQGIRVYFGVAAGISFRVSLQLGVRVRARVGVRVTRRQRTHTA